MPQPTDPTKRNYMFSDDMKFLQKAFVFHPTDLTRFLALRRPSDAYSRPNDWDLPGGNVLFGVLHEDSLRNEIREETTLEVGEIKPIYVVTNFQDEIYYLYLCYKTTAKSVDVTLSEEHSEYAWVTKDEFLALKPAQYLYDSANQF